MSRGVRNRNWTVLEDFYKIGLTSRQTGEIKKSLTFAAGS